MNKGIIIEVLKKWNIWDHKIDAGIKRPHYIKKIFPYIERKEIIVLKGIRRSGKSTIIKQLMHEMTLKGINKIQLLYLNLEDYNFTNDLTIRLFDEVIDAYKEHTKNKKKVYFFIDEVQKIEGWEKWVRTKYDLGENIKFIVSGSSASLLSKELSTLLTGRNLSFKIIPLSFAEFTKFSSTKSLDEYLKYGGFPEVVLEKSEDKKLTILEQYFDDIVHKDIIDRYKIRNAKQIIELARYIVSTSGSKVSINKLSNTFGISKDTISLYLGYMVDACLLAEVTYFSYSAKVRHDVTKLSKYYVLDNGLINVASIKFSKNFGQMYENSVLIKLIEDHNEISYWSEDNVEVDFIVGNEAINVTATDIILPREMNGLIRFKEKHKQFNTILITKTKTGKEAMPLLKFLLR